MGTTHLSPPARREREVLPRSAGDARDPTLPPIARPSGTPSQTRLRAASRAPAAGGVRHGGAGEARRAAPPGAAVGGVGFLRWLGRLTVFASVAGGLYALGYGGWRFLTSSPRFDVAEVDVDRGAPLRHADAEDLVRRANVLGKNVFSVDLEAVRRDLEADPWVRKVEVARELPARILLEVREEHAAVLVAMGALYLADEEGRLFKRLGPGDPADLPVVTGIGREEYESAPAAATARIRDGIAAAAGFADSPAAKRARLEEVAVDRGLGITLLLALPAGEGHSAVAGSAPADAVSVRLGRGGHNEKLTRLVRVLDAFAARHVTPGLIVLDDAYQPDRVIVRTVERAIVAEDS